MFPTTQYGAYSRLGIYGSLVSYGSLELTAASPAQSFTEPLSLSEVATMLRLDGLEEDPNVQDELNVLIMGAREQAEICQGRDLVRKQWDLHHDYWPSYRLELRAPLRSVDLVQYEDSSGNVTTMTENTDYIVDKSKHPGLIAPPFNHIWPVFTPRPSSAILIRFTSGYDATDLFWSDAGARLKMGMKWLISMYFTKKIPYELREPNELPFGVSAALSQGAVPRAR